MAVELSKVICTQCGGENEIPPDEKFIECSFCGSALYIDKRNVVSHFVVTSNFTKESAEGNLRRWMAGNFQIKDLDKLAKITSDYFYYFPVWYFKINENSADKIYLQPGAATSISEIKKISIPAGNLKQYNPKDYDPKLFVKPDVLLESAKSWLRNENVNTDNISETSLIHIPIYQFYYEFKGKQYTAFIESSSGKVYANIWPLKSEMPYRAIFALSIVLFFMLSILSYAGAYFLMDGHSGFRSVLLTGEVIKFFLYLLVSPPLIFISYMIAKKV
jgi:DNA-directed RNA polymerase subunit RPC12/RpoP